MKTVCTLLPLSLFAVACSSPPPVEEPPLPPPLDAGLARVSVTTPTQLEVGEPLRIAWSAGSTFGATRVSLRLRAPGLPDQGPAGYLATGASPATGDVKWVAPDGTLSETRVEHSAAASGEVTLTLPPAAPGTWAVELVATDGDGVLAGFARSTTWVASGPGLELELPQRWARGDDFVRAAVKLRGTSAQPTRLSAWLLLPDAGALSLPALAPGWQPAAEGRLMAQETVQLLDDTLGRFGEGTYAVSVRLDDADGGLLARAAGTVQVCEAPGTLTGTVAQGTSVLGDGTVLAFDGRGSSVTGVVGSDGTYTLQVPAGRYLIFGRGDDWGAAGSAEVGCGATVAAPLAGSRSTASSSQGLKGVNRQAASDTVAEQKPAVLFGAVYDPRLKGPSLVEAKRAFRENMQGALESAEPGRIHFISMDTLELSLTTLNDAQRLGLDTGEMAKFIELRIDALLGFAVSRFDISADWPLGHSWQIAAKAETQSGRGLAAEEATFRATDRDINESDRLQLVFSMREVGVAVADDLANRLALERERPHQPLCLQSTLKQSYDPGEMIEVTTAVQGRRPTERPAGLSYQVVVSDSERELMQWQVTSDEAGNTVVRYPAPNRDTKLFFSCLVPRKHTAPLKLGRWPVVVRKAGRAFFSPFGVLLPFQKAPVALNLSDYDAYERVPLTGREGLPDVQVAQLDSAKKATLNFIAGSKLGPASLQGTVVLTTQFPPFPISLAFWVEANAAIEGEAQPPGPLVHTGVSLIRGEVIRDGSPLADVPVSVLLEGDGTLGRVDKTDPNGVFVTVYKAPSSGEGVARIRLSTVVDSVFLTKDLAIAYGPPCVNCPLAVHDPPQRLRRGQAVALAANQRVRWSAQGPGVITSDGVVTAASNEGGLLAVTAEAVNDATKKVTVRMVVECSLPELLGTWRGTMVAAQPPSGNYTCSDQFVLKLVNGSDPLKPIAEEAHFQCGPNSPGLGESEDGVFDPLSCTWSRGSDFMGCNLTRYLFTPSLEPGRTRFIYSGLNGSYQGGTCVTNYRGSGVLMKQP